MEKINKCKTCGKEIKKNRIFCSRSCKNKDPEQIKKCRDGFWRKYSNKIDMINEKRRKTLQEKYGVNSIFDIGEVREKRRETWLKKYGVDNPSKSELVKNKIRTKFIDKYGFETSLLHPEVKKKIEQSNIKNYGVDNPFKSREIQEKIKKTNLERYGAENPFKNPEIREKIKKTILDRYGTENAIKNPEIKEKIKTTNIKKYGAENPFGSDQIREKIKTTNLDRYGYENAVKNPKIQEKIKTTNIKKYGAENPFGSDQIREKIKTTNLNRYGYENPLKNPKIQEKIKRTNLEKYGTEYPFGSENIKEKIKRTNLEKYGVEYSSQKHIKNIDDWYNNFAEIYNKFNGNVNKLSEYFGVDYTSINQKSISLGLRDKYVSSFEIELKKLLDSVGGIRYEQNKLKILDNEYQLDLYLPDHNIALECNGLFWHTELSGSKDKYYHLTKTIKCEEKGIHLIHIWEHLWNQKKEIYWSIIGSHLGINEKIFARKCKIVEVEGKKAKEFYDKNHIQGSTGSSVHIGLEYDGVIVSLMSFGKSRFNKNYEYEMTRYCCAIGKNVVGGASKIFDYFVDNWKPNTVISYSDRSIFKGKMYEKMGFEFIGYSEPNYWYTRDYETCYSRIKFQKHKLNKLLENFSPDLTEWENMKNNNWDRYWDCGNGVWSWKRQKK